MVAYQDFVSLTRSGDSEDRGRAAHLAAQAYLAHTGPADEHAALYAALIGFLDDPSVKVRAAQRDRGRVGASRYDMSVYRFDSKLSEKVTVSFRVGFVQVGDRVAKLVLVPDGRNDIPPQTFRSLVRRAAERLLELD